jgi:hypothetical protein
LKTANSTTAEVAFDDVAQADAAPSTILVRTLTIPLSLLLVGIRSEKAGHASEIPGSVCWSLVVPRLFDAACFLIVI